MTKEQIKNELCVIYDYTDDDKVKKMIDNIIKTLIK